MERVISASNILNDVSMCSKISRRISRGMLSAILVIVENCESVISVALFKGDIFGRYLPLSTEVNYDESAMCWGKQTTVGVRAAVGTVIRCDSVICHQWSPLEYLFNHSFSKGESIPNSFPLMGYLSIHYISQYQSALL